MRAFFFDYLSPLLEQLRPWSRVLILGGIALGLWLGLRLTRLDGRARLTTSLAIVLPLLAWHVAVWQLALAGGFQPRAIVAGGRPVPLTPIAIFLPLLIALPLLLRSQRLAAVLDAVSPAWLIGFPVYRVLGYIFL